MNQKRFWIWSLIGLNLLLLSVLFFLSHQPSSAYAQGAAGGKYVAVTAAYTGGTDALYLLHTTKGQMVVMIPEQNQSGKLVVAQTVDVAGDLGHQGR